MMFSILNYVQILMLIMSAIICSCLGFGIVKEIRIYISKKEKFSLKKFSSSTILSELIVIFGLFSAFCFSALISENVFAKSYKKSIVIWIVYISLVLIKIGGFNNKRKFTLQGLKKQCLKHKEILIVLFLCGIIRICMFGNLLVQRWDAGEYYYCLGTACENFNFTWSSIWKYFRLCNHSSIGFAMLFAIGEFLFPRKVIGVLGINLIMTLSALYMIYDMLQHWWCDFNKNQAVVGTVLVSVAPLFLGTFGYVNVDYTLAIIFIYMLYAEYKRKYVLLAFWGVMLTQTKETGVFIVAGYYIAHLFTFPGTKGNFVNKIDSILRNRITWSTLVIALFYMKYIYKLRAFTAWSQNSVSSPDVMWSNSGINCFGFQIPYIITKIKQFFLLNFSWILILLCITLMLYAYKKKIKIAVKNMEGMLGGTGAFIIFSCLYVTYDIVRYNILITIVLIIIIYCVSEQVFVISGVVKKTIIVWFVIGSLLTIQTYIPVDILSNMLFSTVDTGKGKMLYTTDFDTYYGDYLVNNYQYTWIDEAYDEMLESVNYTEKMTIIIPKDEFEGSHIQGNYSKGHIAYKIFWDKNLKRRVMYENENTEIINYKVLENVINEDMTQLSEYAILFFIPYYRLEEKKVLDNLSDQYKIIKECETKGKMGSIKYYILQRNEGEKYGNLEERSRS